MRQPDLRLTPLEPDWSAVAARLRRMALALTGDPHGAEDLCQGTLARILARSPEHADHLGFARRTMVRLWLDEQRSLKRRLARLARAALTRPAFAAAAEDGVDREEAMASVRAAIDRLPARQRAVLVMRLVEGLDYEGIAAALGSTVPAVRASLHLARERVRREVGDVL